MPLERRSATIMATVASLTADPGPRVAKYVITLDTGRLYKWIPDDTTTADGLNILAHTGGYTGRWHRVRWDDKGAALTDGAENLSVAGKLLRILPVATLGSNSVKTLLAAGAAAGDVIRIVRLDKTAYTLAIDDDAGSTTLVTFPVSQAWWGDFRFDGTNFELIGAGQMP